MAGTNDNRPQFQQMLADAEAGLFEVLVAHKVDRLDRNEFDYFSNKDKLNRADVDVHFAAQGFDSSTPENTLYGKYPCWISSLLLSKLSKKSPEGIKGKCISRQKQAQIVSLCTATITPPTSIMKLIKPKPLAFV